jgi:hypothetical protein
MKKQNNGFKIGCIVLFLGIDDLLSVPHHSVESGTEAYEQHD